jgi:site-specific DNA recombinase
MPALRVALYARVSSDQQTEQGTIASQVAALEARILQDGLPLEPDRRFIDEGYSGATLVRPALERLRDAVAAGAVDRVYVHSPDRLARRYAYQVLVIDEFRRLGVEILFLNRAIGLSPEDDLLLQVQGMVAEYERAKILERSRRGKRHAAHHGRVSVLSGAPYGYRYIGKHEGGGVARYAIDEAEAPAVRLMFQWIGHERISIGEVCRRLQQHGCLTRNGKSAWDRTTVWGILKNPAYIGTAAFGKTRVGAMRERLRPVRGGAEQPRWPYSTYDVPEQEWGCGCRFPPSSTAPCSPPSKNSSPRTASATAKIAGVSAISCKGCWCAGGAAMPITARRSARGRQKESGATTPITAAAAAMPTVSAVSAYAPTRNYGPIVPMRRSGGKCSSSSRIPA